MRQTNLGFIIKDNKILLAMKKRGFGVGHWNGAGGKLEEGETVEQALVREVQEEIGVNIVPEKFKQVGILNFYFDKDESWNQNVHVFIIHDYSGGEPIESEEMKPQWFHLDSIPYDTMWEDDIIWLPRMLAGEVGFEYTFYFGNDGKIRDYELIK